MQHGGARIEPRRARSMPCECKLSVSSSSSSLASLLPPVRSNRLTAGQNSRRLLHCFQIPHNNNSPTSRRSFPTPQRRAPTTAQPGIEDSTVAEPPSRVCVRPGSTYVQLPLTPHSAVDAAPVLGERRRREKRKRPETEREREIEREVMADLAATSDGNNLVWVCGGGRMRGVCYLVS